MKNMLTEILIRYFFRLESEYTMFLGSNMQSGSIFVSLKMKEIWKRENIKTKLLSILFVKWKPTEQILQELSKTILIEEIFGSPSDFGDKLMKFQGLHNSRVWNLDSLSHSDEKKVYGLNGMSGLNRSIHASLSSDILKLNLAEVAPNICLLIEPMMEVIPIISVQYYLDIHNAFTYNSIRKSKHINANSIIDYLYEIIYIQHKVAMSLHEYVRLISYAENEKKNALFINAEIIAIMSADLIFSYLKASLEKTIVLIGLVHNITNLDSKKTHKAKIQALKQGIPKSIAEFDYVQVIMELIQSENIDELNSYRSGLLHKKGISDLQPHNYVGESAEMIPLKRIYSVLYEQHVKNTIVLIGSLAMLTNELNILQIRNSNS